MQNKIVKLNNHDNTVTAIETLQKDTLVQGVTVKEKIPRGHKMAVKKLLAGEPIYKYSQLIGYARIDIEPGSHVHTHNLEFRNVTCEYEFGKDITPVHYTENMDTFMGYQRDNGKVGTRNYIAVLTSVNCSATAAKKIASYFTPVIMRAYPNVDGVAPFVHGTGCGMADSGDGFDALQRVMWGYARHPNIAGVLMIGLGCEMNQIDWLLEAYGLNENNMFKTLNIQDVAGLRKTIEVGIEQINTMLPLANSATRVPCPASKLMVALQCGGSDAWSGVTANPSLGYACDLLVAQGGAGVLAETPEIYGAEHLLTRRAASPEIGEKLLSLIRWWEDYTRRNNGSMDNNPSPGNKKGGLTSILEKSLGAVAKAGTTPLNGVYKYAELVTTQGFAFMDSPGYDPVSVTGQIAAGCNIVVFTTGRGSAFGSKPSPTIKVATNTQMFSKMEEDMDVNAGTILTHGETIETVGQKIYQRILSVASGEKSKSEAQGLGEYEFVPWQIGAVM